MSNYRQPSNQNRRKSSKAEKRIGITVILLLVAFVVFAVVFISTRASMGASPTHFMDIPLVQTAVVSNEGTSHIFGARVALEIDNNTNEPDADFLHQEILSVISGLNYEELVGANGMNILRTAVEERLSLNFSEGELVGVFFTEILSDIPMPRRPADNRTTPPRRDTFFEAIFGAGD